MNWIIVEPSNTGSGFIKNLSPYRRLSNMSFESSAIRYDSLRVLCCDIGDACGTENTGLRHWWKTMFVRVRHENIERSGLVGRLYTSLLHFEATWNSDLRFVWVMCCFSYGIRKSDLCTTLLPVWKYFFISNYTFPVRVHCEDALAVDSQCIPFYA